MQKWKSMCVRRPSLQVWRPLAVTCPDHLQAGRDPRGASPAPARCGPPRPRAGAAGRTARPNKGDSATLALGFIINTNQHTSMTITFMRFSDHMNTRTINTAMIDVRFTRGPSHSGAPQRGSAYTRHTSFFGEERSPRWNCRTLGRRASCGAEPSPSARRARGAQRRGGVGLTLAPRGRSRPIPRSAHRAICE